MTTTTPRCDSSIVELPEVLSDLLTEFPPDRKSTRDYVVLRCASGHPYEEDVRTR
jgi:hypothetical protein